MAHVHSAGSALVHSAHCQRLAGPASACTARDGAAQRACAHRSGHHSPGAHRGADGCGATMAEVEQRTALEHPQRRGHPPGMWVEAIAHRSFLSTGRADKPGRRRRSPMRWGLRWPAGTASEWRGRESSGSSVPGEKAARGGARGSAHRGGVHGGGALGQRRGRLRTWETARSGRACARQGEATARLGQRRGAVGMALPVGTFMAWRGRVRGAAQARDSHAATVC
jgi:hypothetical protein